MIDAKELENRFTYHKPVGNQPEIYELLRSKTHQLAFDFVQNCPDSRELSLAITKLEDAVMWANAAIARRTQEGLK